MKKGYILQFTLIIIGTILYFWANIQRAAVPGAIFDVLQYDLKANATSITALGASFMYIYALSQLVIGVMIARYGGFRVINSGAIIFSVGSLLFPFSNSLWLLYLSRALVGLGSATFYLGIIQETRKVVPKNNFGIVLSFVLLIGYMGGIVANAPLVLSVRHIGWRYTFAISAVLITILSVLFFILKSFTPKEKTDKSVHLDLSFFKSILKKKANIYIYIFGCINYSLYYVLQTVIGKKFLEDFCQITTMKAALILSLMGALYAISGPVLASVCKAIRNRRTIFLKIAAINTLLSVCIILFCLLFNIKTAYLAVLFGIMSFLASLSPLLVPLLHDINKQKESGTAISIMTAGFYFMVAILGNITGFILNKSLHFTTSSGIVVYSSHAYLCIFAIMFALALISVCAVFKIRESQKTIRFLNMCHYMEDKYGEHWHDKYEHDIYSNI